MSNTNNNMQTQTSSALHNAIMEAGGKDRPPMLASGDSQTRADKVKESYETVSEDIRKQLDAKSEAVQIILTRIDNDIYSAFDACPNAMEIQTMQYDNQRAVNIAGAKENIGTQDSAYHEEKMLLCKQDEVGIQLSAEQADLRDDTYDKPEDQELEAHYIHCKSNNGEEADHDDDLAKERDLLASLIEQLKCEIDDSKNQNKLLKLSNKAFKEANKELGDVNKLLTKDLDKFQIELDSFVKPLYLKKAKSVNPRLYDIGCYNDNLALMLAPESEQRFILPKEEYHYADHMNAILGVYTTLDQYSDMSCDYLEALAKYERLENELSKRNENVKNKSFNELSKKFAELEKHCISLELSLQHKTEKNDRPCKNQDTPEFPEFLEINELKA
ncbi:hypothetical protein Tco_0261322 [Tanacetum coccineum]